VTEFAVPARVRGGGLATHLRAVMTGTAAVVAIWVGLIVFPNTAHDDIWSRRVSAAAPPSDRLQVMSAAPSQPTPTAYVVAQHGAFVQPEASHPVDQSLQRLAQPPAQSPADQRQQWVQQQRLVSPQPQQQPVQPHHEIAMSSGEADRLLSLGEKFLGQGDIETARAILERVAEARDPRAALILGTTYDPAGLRAMGVIGLPADLNKARSWYSRAVDFGSHEAGKRLALLSLQTR
jgi:TPR repeat protein